MPVSFLSNLLKKDAVIQTPQQLVKNLKEILGGLGKTQSLDENAEKEIHKIFDDMKKIIIGQQDQEPFVPSIIMLIKELLRTDTVAYLLNNIFRLGFESRKDAVQIFTNLMRRQHVDDYEVEKFPITNYLFSNRQLIYDLVKGYEKSENAAHCGAILRECARHECLAMLMIYHETFNLYFDYVQSEAFDIASDAFITFKSLLTEHKQMVSEYMKANYDSFFAKYAKLVESPNYVTRRQSLRLLADFLLERYNFDTMQRFVTSADKLMMIMECLRESSTAIKFEAFHVFKIFVLNPYKTQPIHDILHRNKDKLISYFTQFKVDRSDEMFEVDKQNVISAIRDMNAMFSTTNELSQGLDQVQVVQTEAVKSESTTRIIDEPRLNGGEDVRAHVHVRIKDKERCMAEKARHQIDNERFLPHSQSNMATRANGETRHEPSKLYGHIPQHQDHLPISSYSPSRYH